MKRLLIISLLLIACSKSDDSSSDNCNCELLDFKYAINRNEGIYQEFSRYSCRSFWLNAGATIEDGFILEITESDIDNAHNNFYHCN